MKKVLNIFVSLLLLMATFGVTISKHYCMDELRVQQLGHVHDNVCGDMEGMPGMEGCCSNEIETFVMDEDFSTTNFDFKSNPNLTFLYATIDIGLEEILSNSQSNLRESKSSGPPFVEPNIFVQVQSFLL